MIQSKALITLACTFAALLCSPGRAQAQQNSVVVMPASVDAKVRRGATSTSR